MEVENRRPLKTRGANWARGLAKLLAAKGISPNQISVLSAIFGLLSLLSFLNISALISVALSLILGAVFIQMRLICNLMDGMVAIEFNKKTKSGELFNDVPDRFADLFIIVGVGYATKAFPYAIELGYLGAGIAILTAYVRILGASMGTTHFFVGPMAKPHRMAILTVAAIVDAIWFSVDQASGALYVALIIVNVGGIITVFRRLSKIVKALEEA